MNTFLPYPSFEMSARVLDRWRLNSQRSEARQVLYACLLRSKGWRSHPATVMWRGHEFSLCLYGMAVCLEWRRRGYEDSVFPSFCEEKLQLSDTGPPPWLGTPEFHLAHQSNLLRKRPEHYSRYFKNVPNNLPYIWPGGHRGAT